MEGLLDEVQGCVNAHAPEVRLIGNVMAGDLSKLLVFLREKWDERDAAVNDYLDCHTDLREAMAELAAAREVVEAARLAKRRLDSIGSIGEPGPFSLAALDAALQRYDAIKGER